MFKNLTFNENEKKYIQIARYIRELRDYGDMALIYIQYSFVNLKGAENLEAFQQFGV